MIEITETAPNWIAVHNTESNIKATSDILPAKEITSLIVNSLSRNLNDGLLIIQLNANEGLQIGDSLWLQNYGEFSGVVKVIADLGSNQIKLNILWQGEFLANMSVNRYYANYRLLCQIIIWSNNLEKWEWQSIIIQHADKLGEYRFNVGTTIGLKSLTPSNDYSSELWIREPTKAWVRYVYYIADEYWATENQSGNNLTQVSHTYALLEDCAVTDNLLINGSFANASNHLDNWQQSIFGDNWLYSNSNACVFANILPSGEACTALIWQAVEISAVNIYLLSWRIVAILAELQRDIVIDVVGIDDVGREFLLMTVPAFGTESKHILKLSNLSFNADGIGLRFRFIGPSTFDSQITIKLFYVQLNDISTCLPQHFALNADLPKEYLPLVADKLSFHSIGTNSSKVLSRRVQSFRDLTIYQQDKYHILANDAIQPNKLSINLRYKSETENLVGLIAEIDLFTPISNKNGGLYILDLSPALIYNYLEAILDEVPDLNTWIKAEYGLLYNINLVTQRITQTFTHKCNGQNLQLCWLNTIGGLEYQSIYSLISNEAIADDQQAKPIRLYNDELPTLITGAKNLKPLVKSQNQWEIATDWLNKFEISYLAAEWMLKPNMWLSVTKPIDISAKWIAVSIIENSIAILDIGPHLRRIRITVTG